jgi:hypothetical protein
LKRIECQNETSTGILDERQRREQLQRIETRLVEHGNEHERLQTDYRTMFDENQRKRRLLHDLEYEARNKGQQHADRHARLQHETDRIRMEYHTVKDQLDQLVHTLKFNVEDELRIYEKLLDSVRLQANQLPTIDVRHTHSSSVVDERPRTYPSTYVPLDLSTRTTIVNDSSDHDRYDVDRNRYRQQTKTTVQRDLSDLDRYGTDHTGLDRHQQYTTTTTNKLPAMKEMSDLDRHQQYTTTTTTTTTNKLPATKETSDLDRNQTRTKTSTATVKDTPENDRYGSIEQNRLDRNQTRTKTSTTMVKDTPEHDRYGIEQNRLDRNQTRTTTTKRMTRRLAQDNNHEQKKINMNINRARQYMPELDENYLQSKIHITRKYKGE